MELFGREFAGPFSLGDASIPTARGIYILVDGEKDEFLPLYVGASQNIRTRLKQHIASGGLTGIVNNETSSINVYVCEIDSDYEIQLLEQALITKYQPMLNAIHLNESKKRYYEAKRTEKTRWFSSVVAGTSATIAIAITFSMLSGVFFGGGQALTREELSDRLKLLESSLRETQQMVAKAQTEVKQIKNEVGAIANLPKDSKWTSEASRINGKVAALDGKLAALESALTEDPVKALAVPILRKDLDNARNTFNTGLTQTRSEIAQIYDLNKWFIGLMMTIAVSVLGLAVSSFLGRKDS